MLLSVRWMMNGGDLKIKKDLQNQTKNIINSAAKHILICLIPNKIIILIGNIKKTRFLRTYKLQKCSLCNKSQTLSKHNVI